MSSNVFVVLITGDTGDKARTLLLLGDIGTGGEFAVGNELVSESVILQNITALNSQRKRDKKVIIIDLIRSLNIGRV